METSGVPVLNESGELIGYRGTDTDITDRKIAEKDLNQCPSASRIYIDHTIDLCRDLYDMVALAKSVALATF